MIHVADSNAVYYYHYDGLGSVVALSNSYGNSSYSYEYSAFGQPFGSDPNFTANPYLFTGRRFDYETGLYYYRARYYNPYIGRFLQTDPIGYSAGMNLYLYCLNNPLNFIDPSGLFSDSNDTSKKRAKKATEDALTSWITFKVEGSDTLHYTTLNSFEDFEEWLMTMFNNGIIVTFFEFVGHGNPDPDESGLVMGEDYFGVGDSDDWGWYGFNDYFCIFESIFASDIIIELEACYSYWLGEEFKELLPDAEVYGYTGDSQRWFYGVLETHASLWDSSSEWLPVVIPGVGPSSPKN